MDERQLRHVIRQIIKESPETVILREYGEDYSGALYKAFIEPFVDVAKSAKLFSQDSLNILKMTLRTLTTLSPKKMVKARDDYNKAKEVLQKEWDPILKSASESIKGSDLGVVTFALAPTVFFGLQLGKFAGKAPASMSDYLSKAGWNIPFLDKIRGVGVEAEKRADREEARRAKDQEGGILKSLRVFFMGESVDARPLILEADEDITRQNFKAKLDEYMGSSLEDLTNAAISAKEQHGDDLKQAALEQINMLRGFRDAQSIEDFENAVKDAQTSGFDISDLDDQITKLKEDMSKKAKLLRADPEFISSLKKSADDDISDKDIDTAAAKVARDGATAAYDALKQSLDPLVEEASDSLRSQIEEELTADLPEKGTPLYNMLVKTAGGKRLLDTIEKVLDSVGSLSG